MEASQKGQVFFEACSLFVGYWQGHLLDQLEDLRDTPAFIGIGGTQG